MKRRTNCRRGKKGGMAPLQSGPYPGSGGGQWSTSVGGNSVAAAANAYKPFLSQFAAESGGAGANPALARELAAGYAMTGPGQTGGGSRRHKRHHKRGKRHGSKRMRMSQSQAQGDGQSGGMFATFGALLKEALVPLGLLAAQQAYGKSYGKKHRSSKNYTRKRRGGGAGNIAIY
jgi:hypothetical protein